MRPTKPLELPEFVVMLAMMISIIAMSIDAMLPALDAIGNDLGLDDPNRVQLVVSSMFFGFAIGQICAGPLSDSYGRKPVIYVGYLIFITGCIISMTASNFTLMLIGRVLQGLGAAAPRIVSMAIVRDGYEGRAMAQIMSVVMAIFILVPAIASAIGQLILVFGNWRSIFAMLLVKALIAFVWFAARQPETLSKENRRKFSVRNIVGGIVETLSYRAVTGYTLASGIIFGAFLGYLSSAQQIFQETFNKGEWFAFYFGLAALAIGAASLFNSRVVMKLGMRYMTRRALMSLATISILFLVFACTGNGSHNFPVFMLWLLSGFFCIGILFGNFNALAMEPIGHMAGLGAAVVGSLSTFISLPIGWAIGAQFDGSIVPLVSGFSFLSCTALVVVMITERIIGPE